MSTQPQKLYRNTKDGVLAGVCAGLANYFKVDAVWVRLIFVSSIFFGFARIGLMGPVIYVVFWIILPIMPYVLFPEKKDLSSEFDPENEFKQEPDRDSRRPILGIILLGIGVLFLLFQLDYLDGLSLLKYWPVLIIASGISIIITSFSPKKREESAAPQPTLNDNENEI